MQNPAIRRRLIWLIADIERAENRMTKALTEMDELRLAAKMIKEEMES